MDPYPADDLEALRDRITRIEGELAEAKRALTRLEQAGKPLEPPPEIPRPEPPVLVEPPVLAAVLTAVPPARTRPLRDWLVQFNLWPPQEDGAAEVRLGAWWATRIGALLAVIGVVFFAIYISRNTPAWVKLGELVAVALGTFAGGLWLERRVPKFGSVVTGAGMALIYFSSVAAHAVPATRVITDPFVAAAVQLAAVGLLVGAAVWRRAVVTATMAIVFGYGSALAAALGGLERLPLWSSLGLAIAAVALRFRPGWRSPSVAAVPLAYLVCLAWGHAMRTEWAQPDPGWVWLPLLAVFLVLALRDLAAVWRKELVVNRDDRLLQSFNASAAIAVGWVVTWWLLPEWLEVFYFGAAGILLAMAWAWRHLPQPGSLMVITAGQAAALAALGLVVHFDGHLRWLALLAQACMLCVVARFSGLRGLRVMAYVVWVWSLGLFVASVGAETVRPVASILVYLGFSSTLLALDQRWLSAERGLSCLGGALLGLAAWRTGMLYHPGGWSASWLAGVAALLAAGGWAGRGWRGPAVATGIALAGAHLAMFAYHVKSFPSWQLWTNGSVLVVAVLLLGWFWDRQSRQPGVSGLRWRAALAIMATLALQAVFWMGLRHAQDLTCTALVAVVLLAASPWARRWPLALAGTVGLASGWYLHHPLRVRPDYPLLFVAAALAWVLPIIWQHSPIRRELIRGDRWRRALPWLQSLLATWIMVLAVRSNFAGKDLLYVTAAEALAVILLAWKLGVRPAWAASSVLLMFGAWWTGLAWLGGPPTELTTGDLGGMGAVVTLVAVMLIQPVLARGTRNEKRRGIAAWLHGAAALGLLFWLFAVQSGHLASYATVLWAGAGIAVFGLGLFLRERIYRLLGLAGLALCVPRMFLVDLHSTLYRIVAFVVLGLVLLWVGFSYHRFRHLVAGETDRPNSDPDRNEKL